MEKPDIELVKEVIEPRHTIMTYIKDPLASGGRLASKSQLMEY